VICPSCRTVSACPCAELPDVEALRRELELVRDELCRPGIGEYPRAVSWEQSRSQAECRAEEWARTAMGRLLTEIGG
jgi:hypothetical protein